MVGSLPGLNGVPVDVTVNKYADVSALTQDHDVAGKDAMVHDFKRGDVNVLTALVSGRHTLSLFWLNSQEQKN